MTEFNLSEKRETITIQEALAIRLPLEQIDKHAYYKEEDVKEFIRLLKIELHKNVCDEGFISFSENAFNRDIVSVIDKLAGEKLT